MTFEESSPRLSSERWRGGLQSPRRIRKERRTAREHGEYLYILSLFPTPWQVVIVTLGDWATPLASRRFGEIGEIPELGTGRRQRRGGFKWLSGPGRKQLAFGEAGTGTCLGLVWMASSLVVGMFCLSLTQRRGCFVAPYRQRRALFHSGLTACRSSTVP